MEIGYRSENGPVFKKDERRVNQVYNIESNLSRDNCYISVKFKSGNSYFCSWDRRNSQWTATSQVQEFKIHYPSNFRFYVEKPVVGWPRVVKVYDCRSVIEWIELFEDDLNPPAVPNEQVSQENEKQKLVQKLEGLAEKEQQSAADPVATNGINDLANVLALIPEKWTEGNEADESKTSMTQQFVCRVMKDTGERIRDSEQPPE